MSVMVHISRETTKCVSTTCLLLATLLASFSVPGYPQTQLASVLGTVTDASGAVVSDAHVTFHNKSTGLKRDASTDLNGQYRVTGLSTGSYSARVEKEGFQTQVREELALTSASEFLMNLSLTVGDLKQEVTVSADVPTIDNSTLIETCPPLAADSSDGALFGAGAIRFSATRQQERPDSF